MIALFDLETQAALGTITDAQFEWLRNRLEEESADDTDYYVSRDTLDAFEEQGADPGLLSILRAALGSRDEMEFRWERTGTH